MSPPRSPGLAWPLPELILVTGGRSGKHERTRKPGTAGRTALAMCRTCDMPWADLVYRQWALRALAAQAGHQPIQVRDRGYVMNSRKWLAVGFLTTMLALGGLAA